MTNPPTDNPTKTETHRINADDLVARVKEIVHEGNVRRIIIQGEDGATIMEIPLTMGLVGAVAAPVWVALGAHAVREARRTGGLMGGVLPPRLSGLGDGGPVDVAGRVALNIFA